MGETIRGLDLTFDEVLQHRREQQLKTISEAVDAALHRYDNIIQQLINAGSLLGFSGAHFPDFLPALRIFTLAQLLRCAGRTQQRSRTPRLQSHMGHPRCRAIACHPNGPGTIKMPNLQNEKYEQNRTAAQTDLLITLGKPQS